MSKRELNYNILLQNNKNNNLIVKMVKNY